MNGNLAPAPTLYLFPGLERAPWWRALVALEEALAARAAADELKHLHALLLSELAARGYADPKRAAALELLGGAGPLAGYAAQAVPAGLLYALERDLSQVFHYTRRDHARLVSERTGESVPALAELAPAYPPGMEREAVDAAAGVLAEDEPKRRLERFLEAAGRYGSGPSALYEALTWSGGALTGVSHPDAPAWGELVGLDEQLARLERNVDALLAGAGAHHALLYGPRGSGKSTAVRGLLGRFPRRGLRLVELAPGELGSLPALVELLRRQPTSFVIYVDDLAFEAGETAYRPLKSLLEGSLASRPRNLIVIATSNRRHLVNERHGDRPAPADDVHGWDTHHERLALADRFGLTITFPSAGQRSYLEMVRALAALRGLGEVSPDEAIRFAEWGNGYSGRTARQFVEDQAQGSARRASEAASS